MTKLENVKGYGIIGGYDTKNLEPEKASLNNQNEWAQAIKKYLATGEKSLEGGRKAVHAPSNIRGPVFVSSKQRAALRRS